MGLGSTDDFSLEQARKRARAARQLLADGIDPLEAKRAERAKQAAADARNKTFAQVTKEYFDANEAGWSKAHRSDFLTSFKHASALSALPINAVDKQEDRNRRSSINDP